MALDFVISSMLSLRRSIALALRECRKAYLEALKAKLKETPPLLGQDSPYFVMLALLAMGGLTTDSTQSFEHDDSPFTFG